MSQDKLKYITVVKDIYEQLKTYSEVTGIKMYRIASDAIKEYFENHPLQDDEQIEDLIKTA